MNGNEVWEHFMKQDAIPLRNEQLHALRQYFDEYKEMIARDIVQLFNEFCLEIKRKQTEGELGRMMLFQFSLLRSALMEGEPVYMLEALDRKTIDQVQITPFRLNAKWIFNFMNSWTELLEQKRKAYMNQIKSHSLEAWLKEQIYPFHMFMVHAVRYAMDQIESLESFQQVAKEPLFDIRVGEYKDSETSESVYRKSENQRLSITCKGWLENLLEHAYIYEHIAQVDISKGSYRGIRLNYTRFEEVDFTGSQMQDSLLLGTRFIRCTCDEVDFRQSVMFDADFRDCSLVGARLDDTLGTRDVMSEKHGTFFGIHGVRFMRANLSQASFRGAKIAGDFTYANLDGADFTGAELTGSRMLQRDIFKVSLTEEQRQSVHWVEE
ncbi:pentapeptide repeat-containing protein [Paenibacillus macerans]|uniref:pentapeptide repeat-containing protein n=1 Tax=Paenibacillus macerans TaxID=44252 RepID=UPI000EE4D0D2|nr:pentapeptide repeat-containing protein [Paenibacillus macerans]MBS5909199.1 pentapeptide repeat-containing protein [Paenibacillus macerans]MDU5945642.1 pentapeptide repeat-containing protein [Paenibacillus macerans]UMV47811.1 pentapeptide repeat-containing protein [Paenibacillus macerans]GBK64751.1 pentapeptide repeat-containing protein [Paenibacillus macerans]GBK70815.1 pentapeptide repeat-containing protein [Paenibacillus macerans]